jgi:hypothetical protein
MMEKIPLIEGWQTQSDGVDGFIEHKFYKRVIPTGLNHKNSAPLFRLPRRGIGMGLIEMPHSVQKTEEKSNYNQYINKFSIDIIQV